MMLADLRNVLIKSFYFIYDTSMYLQPFEIFDFFHKIIFIIDIIKRKVWFSFLSTLYFFVKIAFTLNYYLHQI